MSRPDTPYEAASYDLKQFRERRMAERRATPRDTVERRMQSNQDRSWGGDRTPLIVHPPVSE